jgi:tripartite-type tricarboxylate transporter receptor subunit TctC
VQVLFSAYPSLVGAVDEKKISLLATNGAQRSPQAPDVPAIADVIPGFDFAVMIGVLARKGTPPAIIQKIASESVAVVQSADVAKQYAAVGIEQSAAGAAEFKRALLDEMDRVTKLVQSAGIKLD